MRAVHYALVVLLVLGGAVMGCADGGEIPEDQVRIPHLRVIDGDAMAWRLGTGESGQAPFTIENKGTGRLSFELRHDADWLVLEPSSGDVEPGEAMVVQARVSCPIQASEFETTVVLEHNDRQRSALGLQARLDCDVLAEEQLDLRVDGLPPGVAADVVVDGPDGFRASLDQGGMVGLGGPGNYTLTARPVGEARRYTPDPPEMLLTVALEQTVQAHVTYELVLGSAQVQASGLPAGADPERWIEGDGGQVVVPLGGLVGDLEPGEYIAYGDDFQDGPNRYRAEPQGFSVRSDQVAQVTLDYRLAPGEIEVEVLTVGDVTFEVTIAGPQGFSQTVDGAATIDTAPVGQYSVTVEEVSPDGLGNPGFVEVFSGTTFGVFSDQTAVVTLRAVAGATVAHGDDEGPGSLRQVIDEVVAGSQVVIDESAGPITLEGEVVIDKSLEILGQPGDGSAVIAGGGGRIFSVQSGADLILDGVTLRDGAAGEGGAVRVSEGGQLVATRSIFEQNLALSGSGGAVYVDSGGGAHLRESVFRDNLAANHGGAIATAGFGSAQPAVVIEQSLFIDNEADARGGALFVLGDESAVWESTFVGNSAGSDGGAIAIWEHSVTVVGATITGNEAANRGGGIYYFGDFLTELVLGRSVVALKVAGEYADIGRLMTTTDVVSLGYNFVAVEDGGAGLVDGDQGDRVGSALAPLNPQLVPPADNGGFSRTRQPTQSSPLRAAVPADACESMGDPLRWPLRDQRGERRPAGGTCNIGAFELESNWETFENAAMSATQYETGSFVGDGGVAWSYDEVRRTTSEFFIDGTGLILRADSAIESEPLAGGISSVSMQLSQAFTANADRQVEVFINGQSVGQSEAFRESGSAPFPVYRFAVDGIDVAGSFQIEVRSLGAQVVVDNLTWR